MSTATIKTANGYDKTQNAFVFLDFLCKRCFDGYAYHGYVKYTIDAEATAYLQIKTDSDAVCFIVDSVVTDGDKMTLKMYENPTITDGSSAIALINRNRASSNTSSVSAYSDPAGVSGGTQIDEFYVGGSVGFKAVGGDILSGQKPLVLKTNEDYVISITNDGAASSTILLRFSIIES
ncbi:MAG: hypothetical protein JRD89_04095 [Deltaproteobacteria bacterium]|nr:hypothetical protein [Deltaproteobacteria bacterium]